ncbi:calpain-B-like [Macrosteles quadrilineatus]|uniref:calpain-B-like n=1 Tax=Macrosteles quadrilineatus TaxID=74068 RepID=UPI0023E189E3|nr:calpain-B-like [Macrosteles quadrilineatus]
MEQPVYKLHNQDFEYIRDWLLRRGYIFSDPHFKLDEKYEWHRPWALTEEPQLFVGEPTQHDVFQGGFGNCHFQTAMTCLGVHSELVKQVVPPDQSFYDKYAGIFHFRFWKFGRWYDVVIDDRLPTLKGKLVSTKAPNNVFWPTLLEKAYCKLLYGKYVDEGGREYTAMQHFTGGVVERIMLDDNVSKTKKILLKAFARRSLIGCAIPTIFKKDPTPQGLDSPHGYSMTGIRSVSVPGRGEVILIRLRNPWGHTEWKGAWSDGSREWELVPESLKEELAVVDRNDGEFVMEYSDFLSYFSYVGICYLSPNVYLNAYGRNTEVGLWHLDMVKGSWIKGVTAGGVESLHKNPQIRFKLSEADVDNDGDCSVLIALLRKLTPQTDFLTQGFKVYRISDLNQPALDQDFLKNNQPVCSYDPHNYNIEIVGRYEFKPGAYCVIIFTEEGESGDFLLRIYTENKTHIKDSDSTIKVGLSPEDVQDSDAPVSRTTETIKEFQMDQSITDFFHKVSGPDKEVDWKDLKKILDFGLKKRVLPAEDSDGWGHFLFDAATFIYNKVFEPTIKGSVLGKTTGGYSYDLCRSMVALLDTDHSGKLSYNEFQALWKMIKTWESIYELYSDKDTGCLNSAGLQNALKALNFSFGPNIFSSLIRKYATRAGYISFEDFLHCAIKINIMIDFFTSKDESTSRKIRLTFEELVGKALYS